MIRFLKSLFRRRRPVVVATFTTKKHSDWLKKRDQKCLELSGGREWRAR